MSASNPSRDDENTYELSSLLQRAVAPFAKVFVLILVVLPGSSLISDIALLKLAWE